MKISEKSKKIIWNVMAVLLFLILNTAGIVWLVMVMINQEVEFGNKIINITYLSTLETKYRICIYVFAILGIIASFIEFKFLYKKHKESKKEEKEEEREEKTNKLLEKILDGKK